MFHFLLLTFLKIPEFSLIGKEKPYEKNFGNHTVLMLPAENKNYIWKRNFSVPSTEIHGRIIFCEQFSQFFEIPKHLAKFVKKSSEICLQPPSVFRVDSLNFLRNENDELLKNTDEIDEKTQFSLVVRTNYQKSFQNNQEENLYQNEDSENFLNDDFLESWFFFSEEIIGKCEPYKCEFDEEKLPILMKKYFKNKENRFWFIKDSGNLENLTFENQKMIIQYKKHKNLNENFLFFVSK